MKTYLYEEPRIHITRKRGSYKLIAFSHDTMYLKTNYSHVWKEPIANFGAIVGKQRLSMRTYQLLDIVDRLSKRTYKYDYAFANSIQHKLFTILSFKL